jgi:hypothetical protein
MKRPVDSMVRLFAKRRDVRSDIGCLSSVQQEIRHLGMRIKQKEHQCFGTEIWLASNCSKRRNVGTCLPLITINFVTGGTPTFLCVPKTLSELMTWWNRLSWRNDRAALFLSGRPGLTI